MKDLQVIKEQEVLGKQFRVYGDIENPLFLAKDVAEWIDYSISNVGKMLDKVDEEEKTTRTISTNGNYTTQAWFLTEDGLYEVLMQSRKPIAKQFKKEVKKILKQIRMTGGYIPVKEEETDAEIMAKALLIAQSTIENKNKRINELENTVTILQPKADYMDNVLSSDKLLTTTDIAKDLGMSARKLNKILNEKGIIYKLSDTWHLYSKYQHMVPEYADYVINEYGQQLKWTEKGRKFIIDILNK